MRGVGPAANEWRAGPPEVVGLLDPIRARRAQDAPSAAPFRRSTARIGRNDPCPWGSGKKYKSHESG
jgi:uncharacterized protein YecA (UPF0149 family)